MIYCANCKGRLIQKPKVTVTVGNELIFSGHAEYIHMYARQAAYCKKPVPINTKVKS